MTTLFNTGVNDSGVALFDNEVDPHYTLSANANGAETGALAMGGREDEQEERQRQRRERTPHVTPGGRDEASALSMAHPGHASLLRRPRGSESRGAVR